jgi:hypothetical protein
MQIGLLGLIQSKKGTLSLIILACSTVAVMLSKIDGMSYAAVVGTIGTIYCWTAHKVDIATSANLPPRGL